MLFYNIETKEFPRYIGDLEILGWKKGEPLPQNWVEVVPDEETTFDQSTQIIDMGTVINENGVWKQKKAVRDMTNEEIIRFKIEDILFKKSVGIEITEEESILLQDNLL